MLNSVIEQASDSQAVAAIAVYKSSHGLNQHTLPPSYSTLGNSVHY